MIDIYDRSGTLSTMGDKKRYVGPDNIRGLVQDLAERSDALAHEIREKTVFAGTRPADAKAFMLISRRPRGLTELAKALQVSRQAAHKAVQRLVDAGVVSYDYAEGSKRDMIATLTKDGLEARKVGLQIAATVEDWVSERIGKDDLETLRSLLVRILRDEDNATPGSERNQSRDDT